MPKYKITKVENPEQYEKPMIPDLSYHRSYFYKWEFMETKIYGNHQWNYYKPWSKDLDIDAEYNKYFTDYKKCKKELMLFCQSVLPDIWLPEDILYITGVHGTLDIKNTDKNFTSINFAEEKDREFFRKKNVLTEKDFLRWVLLVATWESISCTKDIITKFYTLIEKFKIFMRADMTPSMVAIYFNKKIANIKNNNIEPLENVQLYEYYQFILNPLVYTISIKSALDKIFFMVERSNFLKGNISSFKPSFSKYTQYLEKIFAGAYNNNSDKYLGNINNIRRLTETEIQYYDFFDNPMIKDDIIVPDNIIEKYSLKGKISNKTIEPVDKKELEHITKLINNKLVNQKEVNKKNLEDMLSKYSKTELKKTPAQIKLEKIENSKKNLTK